MTSSSWPAVKVFAWAMFGYEHANPVTLQGPSLPPVRDYVSVMKEIRDALAEDRVTARGLTARKNGANARLEMLDSEEFRIFANMAVDVCGETVPLSPRLNGEIPKRFEIVFEEREIKSLFPDRDCETFLYEYLTKNPQAKQPQAIKACIAETKKPVRQAKSAWKKVSKKWDRGRGKRIR